MRLFIMSEDQCDMKGQFTEILDENSKIEAETFCKDEAVIAYKINKFSLCKPSPMYPESWLCDKDLVRMQNRDQMSRIPA